MKLQVAIDLLTTEAALELAGQVAEFVDIIELGTPADQGRRPLRHHRDEEGPPGQGCFR